MDQIVANSTRNTLAEKEPSNKYTVDKYEIDLDSDNDSHATLAKEALGSKYILDVGCGVGYIGKKVKSLQNCVVDGIELEAVAAEIAAKSYDHVYQMKLGDSTDQNFCKFLKDKRRYNCILCGDIIEHLAEPDYIISILARKLSPDGKIIVSIPNIAHIDVIAGLLDGKFNYAARGILDSTHLRFFTEKSFVEFIANINKKYDLSLSPKIIKKTHVQNTNLDSSAFEKLCGDEIFVFQNIFRITSKNTPSTKVRTPKNYEKITAELVSNAELKKQIYAKEIRIRDLEKIIKDKIGRAHV